MKISLNALALAVGFALMTSGCGVDDASVAAPDDADAVSATTPATDDAMMHPDPTATDAMTPDTMAPADTAAFEADAPPVDAEAGALGVLNAINEHEIAAAQMALDKGVDGDVADYARRMIDEHTANRDQTAALGPDADSPAAREQAAKGKAKRDQLATHEGDAFEDAYVQAMITDHSEALAALDGQLIPAATTAEARTHLQTTRDHVANHLEMARDLGDGD